MSGHHLLILDSQSAVLLAQTIDAAEMQRLLKQPPFAEKQSIRLVEELRQSQHKWMQIVVQIARSALVAIVESVPLMPSVVDEQLVVAESSSVPLMTVAENVGVEPPMLAVDAFAQFAAD